MVRTFVPQTRARAPKRTIERRMSILNIALSGAEQDFILHTVEDTETLVRTLLDLRVLPIADTLPADAFGLLLEVQPNGVSVALAPAAGSNDLDNATPEQEIARWAHVGGQGSEDHFALKADIKAQRKLKTNDTLNLRVKSDASGDWHLVGIIYQWFKQ